MRKLFLLMAAMLFTVSSCLAVNWVEVGADGNSTVLFVDTDNIQYVKPGTCYYPVMYKKSNNDVMVSFVKSNYENNTIGVIREDDYEIKDYNPMYIYTSYSVFMRPVIQNSALLNAHKYVSCLYTGSKSAAAYCNGVPYVKEVKINANTPRDQKRMKSAIKDNWKLPSKGKNKTALVTVYVGEKGALNGYQIIQSTGESLADRAIVSAIELAAPFKNMNNANVNVFFRSGLKKRTVK